uniref:DNA damage-binding protein 1 n=1 Tax=Ananas comosus var. bracteatus TaxID=296719 RepID=A0A6V7NIP3_ANACO|nr:unnamed protein product [Ananas comosus var. bracteatus]
MATLDEGSAAGSLPPPQPAASSASAGGGGGGGATHYLVKCVLRGSAVLHAVRGRFRSPSSVDVVFGKETSLELVVVGDDGVVQSICDQSVFGIIKDLAVLQWNDRFYASMPKEQGKDLLIVLSDSGKLSFLNFCSEMHRFFAIARIELSKPGNSRHQLGRLLAVDPEGRFIAVSAYEDRFALFSVVLKSGSSIIDEKIFYPSEIEDTSSVSSTSSYVARGTIWSMCFIPSGVNHPIKENNNPILAVIMHRKGSFVNDLILFGCDTRTRIIHVISRYVESGPLALSISSVPHLFGLALLFRVGDILLMDLRDPENICCIHRIVLNSPIVIEDYKSVDDSCRGLDIDDEGIFTAAACALLELRASDDMLKDDDPMNIDIGNGKETSNYSKLVCSWSWEPDNSANPKLIFCLDTGELFLMEIYLNIAEVMVTISDCLYMGLPFMALLWAKGGLIAGLVEMGDGMVLKMEDSKLVYKSSIQNISPILDLAVADYYDEKQDQMFACCGMSPEGSLRIIRSGIGVEKLLRTSSVYHGVTGTWALKMKETDTYHSFLVLSFVEETRVLSVGVNFRDVTDAVGFQPNVCTLACGLVSDGLLVQIHNKGVRLCLPTTNGHPEGVPLSVPICNSWSPDKITISVGAVGHNLVIVTTSNPFFLFILSIRPLLAYHYELYVIREVKLYHEVSCISIPRGSINSDTLMTEFRSKDKDNKIVVIGTHKPSVEVLLLEPNEAFRVLASGLISINNGLGCPITGCIPEDVRFVSVDKLYVLAGLRNGMLLRFEWPARCQLKPNRENLNTASSPSGSMTSYSFLDLEEKTEKCIPVILQLIAIRRIGITPVSLVPLHDLNNADIIVLSDRPWLLHSARHSLAYTSISFQAATHVTPVSSVDFAKGILFVAENSLHLVEMVHGKRLNVQKFSIGGTPRKVLYHSESRTLLVMRTGLNGTSYSSDICRVDPLSGSLLSKFRFEHGETAKCMEIMRIGNEHLLIVGTMQSSGRAIMPSGEAESTKGRLVVLSLEGAQTYAESSSPIGSSNLSSGYQIDSPSRENVGYATEQLSSSSLCSSPEDTYCDRSQLGEMTAGHWRLVSQSTLSGAVLSVCSYCDRYLLASAGNMLIIYGFSNENHRPKKLAFTRTRFTITCLKTHLTRIAVGDCRDGILFYSYYEDSRKLEQVYSDPAQRLVADCALMNCDTAVVSDRRGTISVLSCPNNNLEVNESPERNLMVNCSFYMGETVMTMRKASFSYKLPVDDVINDFNSSEIVVGSAYNSVVASSLLGGVFILIPVTSEEHQLLEAVQTRLAIHPLTSPVLGNNHKEFRGRGLPERTSTILDGDMLVQFLELTSRQQEDVLALTGVPSSIASTLDLQHPPVSVNQVVRVLERVHYALN